MKSDSRGDLRSLSLKVLRDMQNGALAVREKFYRRNFSKIGMREGYMAGYLHLHVKVSPGSEARDYELVICRRFLIEEVTKQTASPATVHPPGANPDPTRQECGDESDPMLVRARHPSQQAEKVISPSISVPSWVGLVRPKGWVQLMGNVPALVFGHRHVEVGGAFTEREMSATSLLPANVMGGSIHGLIEGVPQVFDDAGGSTSEAERRRWQDDFNLMLPSLRVEVFAHSCRVLFEEDCDLPFDIVDVEARAGC